MLDTNWSRHLGLLAALGVLATACAQQPEAPQPPPQVETEPPRSPAEDGGDGVLKLGYVLPETGELAFLGPPMVQASRYAIQQINDAGGVLGEPVPDIVGGDEAGNEQVANQAADRLLAEDVDAIIGAAASAMTLAIIDKVTGAGVVMCSGSNTAPTLTDYDDDGFYFRTAPTDRLQAPVLADTIVGDGHANVAVVARADEYGQSLADVTAEALEESGATVALSTTYAPDTTDFNATVQQLAGANPDAVVVIAFEEGAQLIRTMIERGLGPDRVGVYGTDGLRSEELPNTVAPGNPGALADMKGTAPAPAEGDPGFLDALRDFAPDLQETTFAGQSYDCVNIVALAAEQAGTDDPSVFKDEVVEVTKDGTACTSFEECKRLLADGEDIDYNGASGPLDFVDAGEPASGTYEVWTYNEQGQLQTLDTVESRLPEAEA